MRHPWAIMKSAHPYAILQAVGEYHVPLDLQSLCQKLGLDVVFMDWSSDVGSQLIYDGQGAPVIHVNKNLPAPRVRFEVAYQVGYAISRLDVGVAHTSPQTPPLDAACTLDATDFLVPLPLLHDLIGEVGRHYRHLATIFTVPERVILIRLSQYDSLLQELDV